MKMHVGGCVRPIGSAPHVAQRMIMSRRRLIVVSRGQHLGVGAENAVILEFQDVIEPITDDARAQPGELRAATLSAKFGEIAVLAPPAGLKFGVG
jgi:hypothetical protein